MRLAWQPSAAAAALAVLGVAWLAWGSGWGPAAVLLACALIVALAGAAIDDARRLPPDGGALGLAELVAALELRGHGWHVPVDGEVRLWVPPMDGQEAPRLQPGVVLLRERARALGIAVTPPGAPLLSRLAGLSALPSGGGSAGATHAVRRAADLLGIATEVRGETHGARLRITFSHTHAGDACARAAQMAPWDVQGGCPVCSMFCMLCALCMGPVRTRQHALRDGRVTMELEGAP